MKKLIECVDMRYENGTFLLIPRQANEIDLVMLGFNGTEKWIRLQCRKNKGPGISTGTWDYTATICKHDGASWSWEWGFHGYTLVAESVRSKEKKIVEACRTYCEQNGIEFPGRGW